MDGLERAIIDLIESLYCCIFIGKLKVDKKKDLYQLRIYLSDENFGSYTLAKQCNSDEQFLEFVKKELQENQLIRSRHSKLIIYPYEYLQECEVQKGV